MSEVKVPRSRPLLDMTPMVDLADWLVFARMSNPKLRFALKGDGEAAYPVVKKVLNTLQASHISRFNMITDLEKPS